MLQYIAGDLNGNGVVDFDDQDLLHAVLLSTSLVAGQHFGDIVDTWNFIPQEPYVNTGTGDYFEALNIYEPSSEAYLEMWEDFPGAFNHYEGFAYSSAYGLAALDEDYHAWISWGVKIGDINFSYVHGLQCLLEEVPIFDELGGSEDSEALIRSSVPSTNIEPASLLASVGFEGSNSMIVDFKAKGLTSILGLQLYFKLDKGINNVELLGTNLPGFDYGDVHVDVTKGIFNMVWLDPNLAKNLVENDEVLLSVKFTGEIDSDVPFYQNSSEKNLFVNYEKQEIPVVFEILPRRTSGNELIVTPNPCREFVRFANLEAGHIGVTLYDMSGKIVYKALEELSLSTYTIPFDNNLKKSGMIFYQLENGGQIYQGKLVISE